MGQGLGEAVLDGEEDWPFPNNAVKMMKYFLGLNALSSPINQKLSSRAALVSVCVNEPR